MKGSDLQKNLPTYVLFYLSFQSLTFLKDEILKQVKAPPTKVCQSETIWKPAPRLSGWRPHWNAYLHLYGVFTIVSLFGTKRSHIEAFLKATSFIAFLWTDLGRRWNAGPADLHAMLPTLLQPGLTTVLWPSARKSGESVGPRLPVSEQASRN